MIDRNITHPSQFDSVHTSCMDSRLAVNISDLELKRIITKSGGTQFPRYGVPQCLGHVGHWTPFFEEPPRRQRNLGHIDMADTRNDLVDPEWVSGENATLEQARFDCLHLWATIDI